MKKSERLNRLKSGTDLFRCPICGDQFHICGNSFVCVAGHCFDMSKSGYVNFILNARRQKYYDKGSFENRRRILEKGYFDHVFHEAAEVLQNHPSVKTVLDAGCGEGFYARKLAERYDYDITAFDLSAESIKLAAKGGSSKNVRWFVGDLTHIPIADGTIDCVLNIFSPAHYEEFRRILSTDGFVVKVIPGSGHLKEIRAAAKEHLIRGDYSNHVVKDHFRHHFNNVETTCVSLTFSTPEEDLKVFADMTPLLFNVDKSCLDLAKIRELTIEAEILTGF